MLYKLTELRDMVAEERSRRRSEPVCAEKLMDAEQTECVVKLVIELGSEADDVGLFVSNFGDRA